MAAPLAEIHGDTQSLVAVVFDGIDILPAHVDRLADAFRDIHLAGGGALLCRMIQRQARQIFQH